MERCAQLSRPLYLMTPPPPPDKICIHVFFSPPEEDMEHFGKPGMCEGWLGQIPEKLQGWRQMSTNHPKSHCQLGLRNAHSRVPSEEKRAVPLSKPPISRDGLAFGFPLTLSSKKGEVPLKSQTAEQSDGFLLANLPFA